MRIYEYFPCFLLDSRTKDHIRGPRACEQSQLFSNYEENITIWNLPFQHYREKNKSFVQKENFSSLCADAGKIIEITTFTRGPNK